MHVTWPSCLAILKLAAHMTPARIGSAESSATHFPVMANVVDWPLQACERVKSFEYLAIVVEEAAKRHAVRIYVHVWALADEIRLSKGASKQ